MKLLRIPETLKVGGFDYEVRRGSEVTKGLEERSNFGECNNGHRWISVCHNLDSQQTSSTLCHEMVHAVDHVYLGDKLDEAQTHGLTMGLLQVFEQLGIRFK